MRIDFYTKAVLTVIALCLLWMVAASRSLITVVEAQPSTQSVYVAGWVDWTGNVHRFPSSPGSGDGLPVVVGGK